MIDRAARMQAVEAKLVEVKRLALLHYGMDLSNLIVDYSLKGRVAGWAIGTRKIRLNRTAIFGDEAHFRDMVDDTIAHEIAHIVCHRNPALGRNHDYGWKSVCRRLGGTGKRTHDMTTIEYAKGKTYIYTTSTGHEIGLSETRHRRVQMGGYFRLRNNKGTIDRLCAYVVKHNGQVIGSQPAQTRPTATPVTISLRLSGGRVTVPSLPALSQAPKTVVAPAPVAGHTGSFAEKVRALIRVAKAAGLGQDHVFKQAVNTLGMKASSARNCVKFNWDRV